MRRLIAGLLVTAAVSLSPAAMADPAVERETARALMDEGDRQFQSGDYVAARATYLKARALVRAPTTMLALAEAEEHLGLFVEARDSALEVTRMPPVAGEPPVFAESRELARVLAERVLARIGVLDLTVVRAPACAASELTVDGSRWPEEALGAPLRLNPGRHQIQARAAGCVMVERAVEVPSGGSVALLLELRAPVAAPPASAALVPPPHDTAPDGAARTPIPTGALVLMGAGVLGLAVGATAGAVSLSKTSSVRETCGSARCAAGEDDYQSANTAAWVSNGGFAVAVLSGGAGVLWLLLARRTAAQVTAGPRGASVVVPFM